MRTLCLGEAIVDLVRPEPVDPELVAAGEGLGDAPGFVAHPGGVMANVALAMAACGAQVGLAGGAGDDPWGRWLRAALMRRGVGLDCFGLVPGHRTPVAFVTVDAHGEPTYLLHGDGIASLLEVARVGLEAAVADAGLLCIGSNTMVGEPERALTLGARRQALELGRPVVLDANVRIGRWEHPGRVTTVVGACVPGCLLVKANREEARLLTGETDPERAAQTMLAAGAHNALVTLGAEGVLLRGEVDVDVPAAEALALNSAGAGDAMLGVLLARLADAGHYAPALAAALPEAMGAAARAVASWAAVPER